MEHSTISLDDYFKIIWRNKLIFLISVTLSVGASVAVYLYTPKQYKSSTEVVIQSAFFQNPLVNDVLPEINEISELNSTRESFIKKTLTDDFLDELATEFKLYTSAPNTRLRGTERNLFRQKIESTRSGASHMLAVINEDPNLAFTLLERITKRLLNELASYHSQRLVKAADSIQKRVDALAQVLSSNKGEAQLRSTKAKLIEVQAQITAAKAKFTEQHPTIIKLRETESAYLAELARLAPTTKVEIPEEITIDQVAPGGETNKVMYSELVQKLGKLKILLEMDENNNIPPNVAIVTPARIPEQPFKPRKERFIGVGLLTGLLFAAFGTLLAERRRSEDPIEIDDAQISAMLGGAPLFGTILPLNALEANSFPSSVDASSVDASSVDASNVNPSGDPLLSDNRAKELEWPR